jgi:hypothetical protein
MNDNSTNPFPFANPPPPLTENKKGRKRMKKTRKRGPRRVAKAETPEPKRRGRPPKNEQLQRPSKSEQLRRRAVVRAVTKKIEPNEAETALRIMVQLYAISPELRKMILEHFSESRANIWPEGAATQ